jgi:hypothetical protein
VHWLEYRSPSSWNRSFSEFAALYVNHGFGASHLLGYQRFHF